ncbi:unnamed protein product, partial [Gongylonema pulchrum]|uniref:GIT1_C domain-containing protein n=1 Tax=Gongylonema pulchrum TaxID=637853 RepID=A0A183DA12_9BILA
PGEVVGTTDVEPAPSETSAAVTEDTPTTELSQTEGGAGDSVDDEYGLSCEEKVMTLLAAVKEEFREPIENLSNARKADTDTRCELMQKLLSTIFDNVSLQMKDTLSCSAGPFHFSGSLLFFCFA